MTKSVSILVTFALALALGWMTRPSAAQVAPSQGSIAAGPGGMWVVHQGKLYVCQLPLVQRQAVGRGSLPPTAQCGAPLSLP